MIFMAGQTDRVFKALADPTRRSLLDSLHERNGQTLGELCRQLDMARQSASQHLGVLEAANLVSTVWHGREKLHYLNPVPIYEIQDRWIGKFERPRLQALTHLKRRAEENDMAGRPTFVYVTYIQATPQDVWHALTDADLTAQYWGHSNVSDWQAGSRWEHLRADGSGIADVVGTVLETVPPTRRARSPLAARPRSPSLSSRTARSSGSRSRTRTCPAKPTTRPYRPAGRRCSRTSSPCWRPGMSCRRHRGKCTRNSAPHRWRATTLCDGDSRRY